MRPRNLSAIALGTVVVLMAATAGAAGVTVGAGSSLTLGSADLDLGEHDLTVAGSFGAGTGLVDRVRDVTIQGGGTFDAGAATIQVCGNWSNGGTFNPGSSTLRFVDGCSVSSATISGDSTFFDLEMVTSTGKLYAFEAGSTQTITDSLTLTGAADNLLTIRSTVDNNEAFLDLQGSDSTDFVDVKDNHAIGNPITLGANSVMRPNTDGWIRVVPALSAVALALLMLAILWAGHRRLRAKDATARTP